MKEKIWGLLVHLSMGFSPAKKWKDAPLSEHFDEEVWRDCIEKAAESGMNTIVLESIDGVQYDSHPEISRPDAYSKEWVKEQVSLCRKKGIALIPKLNFSACHDTWLKEYHRMVSTRKYYQVCEDVIKDVAEIFDRPRFLHLGYDEETYNHQYQHQYVVCRQGELWWHDFLWFADVTERAGCRPWIWSDYIWHHKDEFIRRMPKSVMQSNWYYGSEFTSKLENGKERTYVAAYEWLDKAGFEQIPTGSNWSCDSNFKGTIDFCDRNCNKSLIKGYMMAPWTRTIPAHEKKAFAAIDLMDAAIRSRKA